MAKKKGKAKRRFIFWSVILVLTFVASLVAPHFVVHDPFEVDLLQVTKGPSHEYWMGTDYIGRCIACRLITGATRSIFSSIIVVAITFIIGTAIGTVCGYIGGSFDNIVMRVVDAFQAFPSLVFTIAIAAMLGPGMRNCIIAMVAVNWPQYARLSRSQVLMLKERTYVSVMKTVGMSKTSILFKTILPNSLTPLVVAASMHVGNTILSFSGLSFLGLGTAPPFPEWGTMLNDGRATMQTAPWTVFFPGLAILAIVMIMGMFGDSVNEMLNPKKDS